MGTLHCPLLVPPPQMQRTESGTSPPTRGHPTHTPHVSQLDPGLTAPGESGLCPTADPWSHGHMRTSGWWVAATSGPGAKHALSTLTAFKVGSLEPTEIPQLGKVAGPERHLQDFLIFKELHC